MIMMILMKLFSARKFQKGFTLIELLVVIGILGILAAALVATIDPFEQLKKATDSKVKNIAVEFQTASVRYYTTHGAFPWNDPNQSNANCVSAAAFNTNLDTDPLATCIGTSTTPNTLIGEGELKNAFNSVPADMQKVKVIWDDADPTNMTVCYAPESKSQISAPETIYDASGADASGGVCASSLTVEQRRGVCYWCTK